MQPIDLQTLFTQMDKVGKLQSMQREGLQIQQSIQQLETQRRAEEQIRAVNEAQNMGDGAEKVKGDGKQRQNTGQEEGKQESREDGEKNSAANPGFIRDFRLGQNVDISG